MKKNPSILALRERLRCVNAKLPSYAKIKPCAKTENESVLSPKQIIQLIMNHFYTVDKRDAIPIVEEESHVPFVAGYDVLREESILVTLLKIAKRKLPKGVRLFDPDLSNFFYF